MFLLNINICKVIDSGSHGSVHKAQDADGGTLAVKVIKEKNVNLIEPALMLTLKHPYINSCYFTCRINQDIMIFQDNYQNDVHEYLKNNKIPDYVKAKWCNSLILAVGFLHEMKIIHCDIKAKNILIDDNLDIKLSDFSFSLISLPEGKKHYHKVSTFTHAPLECLTETGWDSALDIWCLGCTLYEIRYSELLFPFQGTRDLNWKNKDEMMNVHLKHINCIKFWGNLETDPIVNFIPPSNCLKNRDGSTNVSVNGFGNEMMKNVDNHPSIVEDIYDQIILSCLKVQDTERIKIKGIIDLLKLEKQKCSVVNKKPLRNRPNNLDFLAGNIYSMLSIDVIKENKNLHLTLTKISQMLQGQKVKLDIEDERLEKIITEDLQFMLLNLSRS